MIYLAFFILPISLKFLRSIQTTAVAYSEKESLEAASMQPKLSNKTYDIHQTCTGREGGGY